MGEPANGPCFHCQEQCNGVDDYCYGCKVLICPDCSKNEGLMGAHDPDDHLDDDNQEEDGW